MRYRNWADQVRLTAQGFLNNPGSLMRWVKNPVGIMVCVYFDFPKSYNASKRAKLKGQLHRITPDGDNILKGLLDCLLKQDQGVAIQFIEKRWDDGKGARTEVILI